MSEPLTAEEIEAVRSRMDVWSDYGPDPTDIILSLLATLDARERTGLDVERARSEVSALVSPITASRALGKEPYPKGYVTAINDVLAILDLAAAGEGR